MISYIMYCLNIFFIVLSIIIVLYILTGVFNFGKRFRLFILILMEPVLTPMQKLVRNSIMNCFTVDISPYILLILSVYLQRLCSYIVGL